MVWQLRREIAGQERETKAVRLIGMTFFALAACLATEGIRDLATGARPRRSVPALVIAAAALLVMPGLAVAKRRTGRALGNRTLIVDSLETAFCAATLASVRLNTTLGWWQADPIAGLVIATLAIKKASKPGNKTTTRTPDPGPARPQPGLSGQTRHPGTGQGPSQNNHSACGKQQGRRTTNPGESAGGVSPPAALRTGRGPDVTVSRHPAPTVRPK